jgi:hypothetical protein
MMDPLKGISHFKGHLFKLGMVYSSKHDKCREAFEMTSHVLCDCEELAVLRFRHLGHYVLKASDFASSSISTVLHYVQSMGLLKP